MIELPSASSKGDESLKNKIDSNNERNSNKKENQFKVSGSYDCKKSSSYMPSPSTPYFNRNSAGSINKNTNSLSQEDKKEQSQFIKSIKNFLDNGIVQIVMAVLTLYILFADDIKNLATSKSADVPFSIVVCSLMFIFFLELILSSLALDDYLLGFYFWLDLISLVSMLLDVHWFYDWMINQISSGNGGRQAKTIGVIAKAGKSAKIAARTIKVLRMLRIIRLVRVSKLYKTQEKMAQKDLENHENEKKQEDLVKQKKKNEKEKLKEINKAKINHSNDQCGGTPKNRNSGLKIGDIPKFSRFTKRFSLFKAGENNLLNKLPQFQVNEQGQHYEKSKTKLVRADAKHNTGKNVLIRQISFKERESNSKINAAKNLENKNGEGQNLKNSPENSEVKNEEKFEINIIEKDENQEDATSRSQSSSDSDEESIKGENDDEYIPEESKVGKLLAEKTTKKVIVLVLAMMIGIILFNSSFYIEKKTGMEMGLKIFTNFDSINDPNLNLTFSIYISENLGTNCPLVWAQVGPLKYGKLEDAENLRQQEKNTYTEDCSMLYPDDPSNSICEAVFDVTYTNKISCLLNIIKTIFICLVLSVGSYIFSKDTSEMVLEPIEAMIERVKLITKNPIKALQNAEKDEITKALMEEEAQKNTFCSCVGESEAKNNKKNEKPLETEMLENTINKIGALLALSFGDAGSEIIAKNMQQNNSGEVNPMIKGKKVCAIYGFCDIRNFTDTTEILQEKVMVFVNEIAEIVHQIASEYGGSANKNVGDAFLLVWKFDDKFTYKSKKNNELKVYNCEQINQLCDMALISILKIFAAIYTSKALNKYRKNEKLRKKFGNYYVKIGFGLHLGWSIEGAIGSAFKIDASYLSPNADMANQCEEKTKDYGVGLVMTDKFVENLSETAQKYVRILDIKTEDEETIGYYTVDMNLTNLKINDEKNPVNQNDNKNKKNEAADKMLKFQKRMIRNKNLADALAMPPRKQFFQDYINNSNDFKLMRKDYTDEFYKYYNEGFDEFHFGDWEAAEKLLLKAKSILDDTPTNNMLKIIKENNHKRPKDWPSSLN